MEEIITTAEGRIMKLRALGFSQKEIAEKLEMSQPAVSQRLELIKRRAGHEDPDRLFWSLILGPGAGWLFVNLLKRMGEE
jgi:transcriptional regulator with XRE-family HTH domain